MSTVLARPSDTGSVQDGFTPHPVQWTGAKVVWRRSHRAFSDLSLSSRNVPNRYTFPCPYCPERNFDQEGLVEHCKLSHSMDTRSVVGRTFFFLMIGKNCKLTEELQDSHSECLYAFHRFMNYHQCLTALLWCPHTPDLSVKASPCCPLGALCPLL